MRVTLASVIVLVLTAVAAAQQPNPQSERLFKEGRELADQGKFKEACEKFEQSLELDPAIGTQLNYANCHEKQGHNARAWRLFDSAADAEKITNPDRAKFARGRADALLPKLGVVVLKLATPDAPTLTVSIAGRTVKPAAVVTEIVDPGDIEIAVTAQAAEPFERSEKIAAGKTVTIEVPALAAATTPVGGGAAVVPLGPVDTGERGPRRKSRVMLAYGVGAAGAASLVVGVALGLKARSDYNAEFGNGCEERPDGPPLCFDDSSIEAQNDAISLARVGTVFGVGGLVLVGAGAVLFLTAPRDVVVAPTATASSAGISVVGRF